VGKGLPDFKSPAKDIQSSTRLYGGGILNSNDEKTLKTVEGCGEVVWVEFYVNAKVDSHRTHIKVYTDGLLAFWWTFKSFSDHAYTTTTPLITLLQYAVDGICAVSIAIPFKFKSEFKLTAMRLLDAGNMVMAVEGVANLVPT